LKLKRKVLSILVTMSMLLMLLVPLAGVASASGEIDALTVPVVTDTTNQTLGAIKVTVDAGSISAGDVILFKITGGYDYGSAFSTSVTSSSVANGVYVPATIDSDGTLNGLTNVSITVLDPNDEVQITANAAQSLANDFVFYIYMKDVDVAEGTSADNVVTFSGPTNTGFPKGTVTNATVTSTGMVELAVSGADTSNDIFTFDLRLQETIAGSLKVDGETLKLKLPAGYEWDNVDPAIDLLWGDATGPSLDYIFDNEELTVVNTGYATSSASAWDLTGFTFFVSDDSLVKAGAINAKITGETDTDITTAKVGTYGDFGATVSAKTTPTVYAGMAEQEIGDIVITEDLGETLVDGRTVTLTLPANARFQQVYEADINDTDPADLDDFSSDEGLTLNFVAFTGTDKRTAKFTVDNPTSGNNPATITLENVEVALDACVYDVDLVVTVGGSAGLNAEVVVAKIVAPITAKLTGSLVPNVIIGLGGQAGGEFTITEAALEAFDKDGGTVVLDLPGGIVFSATPTVEVTTGDLRIGNVKRTNSDNSVSFDIEAESSEPSTITVSGILLKLDRTVAEGDITLKIQGDAVVATSDYSDWNNCDFASKFAVAKVVTPAPGDTKYVTVFTIGSMIYTVNGVENTMDVAPYINANDRALLPIRFAANATGVSDSNIFWNATEQSVILSGHYAARIVRMVIGSTTMWINGVPMEMDTVPVLVDPGRTMLPIRYVAQALGADIAWDAATQTITITQTVVVQ
jgi:hypothetical protein